MKPNIFKRFSGEIKRIVPILSIIGIAVFALGDYEQLAVQIYKLSCTVFVFGAINIIRQWLLPYIDLRQLYKNCLSSTNKLPAAIMFASIIALMIIMIIVSVI